MELAEYFPGDRVHSDFVALTGLDGALDERVRQAGGEVFKCRLDARFAATDGLGYDSGADSSPKRGAGMVT